MKMKKHNIGNTQEFPLNKRSWPKKKMAIEEVGVYSGDNNIPCLAGHIQGEDGDFKLMEAFAEMRWRNCTGEALFLSLWVL